MACALLLMTACGARPNQGPLDPLGEREITEAAAVLRAAGLLSDSTSLLRLALAEPAKELQSGMMPGAPRYAEVELVDHRTGLVSRGQVDLANARLLEVAEVPGVMARLTRWDAVLAQRLLQGDARWLEALRRRGLSPRDVVQLHVGPGPIVDSALRADHRLVRVLAGLRAAASPYLAPVEGLVATMDLTARRVVAVEDVGAPPPMDTAQPFAFRGTPQRAVPGAGRPTYRLDGHRVTWEGWQFEFGMDPREGLVLYRVAHRDEAGVPRSILSRASLAEMLVPYGDTATAWRFRSVFDVGEFGLGATATTLVAGADVPDGATLRDAVLADEAGRPRRLEQVIGLYERDGGLRWRHADRAVRARELVVRSVATIGNYDYGVSWVFGPDGVLAVELDLTGVMQVKGIHAADPRTGTQVARHLSAVHHQHFFAFRLDFDVGGPINRIREVEVVPAAPGEGNRTGTGFVHQSRVLGSERDAMRDANPAASRHWIVESADLDSAIGRPRGYLLVPGTLPDLLADEGSPLRDRGSFAAHTLWVTRLAPGERYPAGDSPGQGGGPAGLPLYVADDAPLDGADLVVWYTVGMTHVPRPEEWPLMPVSRLRFELRPSDFLPERVWH